MSRTVTLILPGLYDSGPEHWQSYWERADPACRRVVQADWETPRCADWVARLDAEIAALGTPVVLAAHSLGCHLVAHWATGAAPERRARVHGALLVAPPDLDAPSAPPGLTGFAPVPLAALPFPSTVVASTNDEYVTLDRAAAFARAWGSRFVNAGAAGHLNSASGLAGWPAGRALLDELRRAPAAGTA